MRGHWPQPITGATAACLLLALGLAAGCRTVPFAVEPRVPVASCCPDDLRERFAARLPARFQSTSSVIFDYRWHSLVTLGYATVSLPENTFAAVCLTPLGVKLFEVKGSGPATEFQSVLPEFTQHPEFGQAVGEDIRRVYLDPVPGPAAEVRREKGAVVFTQRQPGGYVEYIFGGRECLLLEKRYYEGSRLVWEIGFYEYNEHEGRLFPHGVVLRNHRYGYSLTLRTKDVRLLPPPAAAGHP